MKTILRRLRRLQSTLGSEALAADRRLAETLRERRRIRLAASGITEEPLVFDYAPGYQPRTLADVLRGRFHRRQRA